MNLRHDTDWSLKIKIWGALSVFALTLGGVLIWNVNQYQALSSAVAVLREPPATLEVINGTFQEIIEAENHIQSFILTDDSLSRSLYEEKRRHISDNLLALRSAFAGDSAQLRRLDTLEAIVNLKTHYLEKFFELKKARESNLFNNDLLSRVEAELNDTAHIDKQLLRRDIVRQFTLPVEHEEVVVTPDDYKGVRGFMRKILGIDRSRVDTIKTTENAAFYTYDVAVDTSIVRDYFLDSAVLVVKEMLDRAKKEELGLLNKLNEAELMLLKQNEVLIANIRVIIDDITEKEERLVSGNIQHAEEVSLEATRIMFVIGLTGFGLSGVFLFLIVRDIARASHYRRQLEAEKVNAQRLAKAKEEFLSSMSHEIRTPLHNITGFCSVLSETGLNEKQREYTRIIEASNQYLLDLVNRVLNAAQIEAGQLQLTPEAGNLAEISREAVATFTFEAERKGIALKVDMEESLATRTVMVDVFRFKEILTNLLSNAVKLTARGSVQLSLRETAADDHTVSVSVKVADTGPGIAHDKITEIFKPFVQVPVPSRNAVSGNGLGLFITKSTVEAMGGSIGVSSTLHEGSVFEVRLTLPLTPGVTAQHQADTSTGTRFALHVVVVEDDPWNALLLSEILKRRCEQVHVFNDPSPALAFMKDKSHRVDLIFSDINMPGMNGEEFVRRLKADGIDVPVVAVTAHASPDRVPDHAGFVRVVQKPFAPETVEQIIAALFPGSIAGTFPAGADKEGADGILYPDVHSLRAFAAGDDALFRRLVNDLSRNNRTQVETFYTHLQNAQTEELGELCHQMKTAYSHLHMPTVVEALTTIEVFVKLGDHARALTAATELLPTLQAISERLAAITHQFHTA